MWVGFIYTFVVKVPSGLGVTKISKKGMEPSDAIYILVILISS